MFYLSLHHNCQEKILIECPSLCSLKVTQLVIRRLVVNAYLQKRNKIYSQSLLRVLPYKMVVQEKEGVLLYTISVGVLTSRKLYNHLSSLLYPIVNNRLRHLTLIHVRGSYCKGITLKMYSKKFPFPAFSEERMASQDEF